MVPGPDDSGAVTPTKIPVWECGPPRARNAAGLSGRPPQTPTALRLPHPCVPGAGPQPRSGGRSPLLGVQSPLARSQPPPPCCAGCWAPGRPGSAAPARGQSPPETSGGTGAEADLLPQESLWPLQEGPRPLVTAICQFQGCPSFFTPPSPQLTVPSPGGCHRPRCPRAGPTRHSPDTESPFYRHEGLRLQVPVRG